jgi:uncharacterized membrane protein
MDPYQSTVTGDWIWQDGGPYFGVPLHNYAGWFGTVFTFMLVYFLFASRYVEQPQEDLMQDRTAFWSLPVFYYALMAIGIIITPLVGGILLPYASPANYTGTHLTPSKPACRWSRPSRWAAQSYSRSAASGSIEPNQFRNSTTW